MHARSFNQIFFFAILAIVSIASADTYPIISTWGFNSVGELGSGSSTIGKIVTTPTPINSTIFGKDVIDICCGENFCVVLNHEGSLFSWGDNTVGQLGDGSGVNQPSPVRVKTNAVVDQISCGQGHVLAVTDKGQVLAWGWNMYGQVAANMDTFVVPTPQPISFFDQNNLAIEAVAAGYQHSMALTTKGKLFTWGDNSMGQLGTGQNSDQLFSNVPNQVKGLPPITGIGAGQDHSFAIPDISTLALFAWGDNSMGQLGTGSVSSQPTYLPVRVNTTVIENYSKDIFQITGGAAHSLALTREGDIFVWGANTFGQLGTGDKLDRSVPTLLELPNRMKTHMVSGGLLHSLVIDDDGGVWAFGGNSAGQCGNGNQQDLESPMQILLKNAYYVAAGKFFSASLSDREHDSDQMQVSI